MKNFFYTFLIFTLIIVVGSVFFIISKKLTKAHNASSKNTTTTMYMNEGKIMLPAPVLKSNTSIEEALLKRRSTREYKNDVLGISELSQLLWAAQGITNDRGFRTAPSAGATFPLNLYVIVSNVTEIRNGFYKYDPKEHALTFIFEKDVRKDISESAYNQSMLIEAPITIVFSGVLERTAFRYGDRAERYVHNEIGHASQNVHLQAVSLNLGTVVIGAYDDAKVDDILQMSDGESVLYMMPVGKVL